MILLSFFLRVDHQDEAQTTVPPRWSTILAVRWPNGVWIQKPWKNRPFLKTKRMFPKGVWKWIFPCQIWVVEINTASVKDGSGVSHDCLRNGDDLRFALPFGCFNEVDGHLGCEGTLTLTPAFFILFSWGKIWYMMFTSLTIKRKDC